MSLRLNIQLINQPSQRIGSGQLPNKQSDKLTPAGQRTGVFVTLALVDLFLKLMAMNDVSN